MADTVGDSFLERMRALEYAERSMRRAQLEASCAQRLLNDEAFLGFLNEMQGNALNLAIYAENQTDREIGRCRALLMEELRGRLIHAAGYAEERREREVQARQFE